MSRRSYADFFDFHAADTATRTATRHDFQSLMARHLGEVGIESPRIVGRVWSEMTAPGRHYHSPVHLLGMFDYAAAAGMALAPADNLAIWFHDAVYEPAAGPGVNEARSAEQMLEQLPDARDGGAVDQAAEIILWTAQHKHDEAPPACHRVLDLDLAGFSAPPESFERQCVALRQEFAHVSAVDYARATVAFLETLLARRRIFRTPEFAGREAGARAQIALEIERLRASPRAFME